MYLSVYEHRGMNPQKSVWVVPPPVEFEMFAAADAHNWLDSRGHYWSVLNGGGTVVGSKGERIAKHPRVNNTGDPWHGYPVSPAIRGVDDAPEDDVVDLWLLDGAIDRTFARRVQRRKI